MIPTYDEYRKTRGGGFAKGTLSRKCYVTVLQGTSDLSPQKVKETIAEVETQLAETRAKETKKRDSKSEIRNTKPPKTKPQPLKARRTWLKKASAENNDDMVPRSEYLKLETEFKEVKERCEKREPKLVELVSDLWKASGRSLPGEDFGKFETRLQDFGIDTRIEDSTNIQSRVYFIAPTPRSVASIADAIDGSAGSEGASPIPSHRTGAIATASNPATSTEPPSADSLPHPGSIAVGFDSSDSNTDPMNSPVQDNVRPAPAAANNSVSEEGGMKRSAASMGLARTKKARWGLPSEEVAFKLFDAESDEYQRLIYEASPCIPTPPFFDW